MNIKQKDAVYKCCPVQARHDGEDDPMYCGSTSCMMWRWSSNDVNIKTEDRAGFCGIAGRPL